LNKGVHVEVTIEADSKDTLSGAEVTFCPTNILRVEVNRKLCAAHDHAGDVVVLGGGADEFVERAHDVG
jgi:hypothetical protein